MGYIKIIKQALQEDVGNGDITTNSVVGRKAVAKGEFLVKATGVVAGLDVAKEVFRQVDRRIKFSANVKDGAKVNKGKVIATVSGPARGILTGERVALNFLQKLSGIATLTRNFKIQILKSKNRVHLLDTRKTTPGLRELEKMAVKAGGGTNHRMGLWDAVLIKDNHIKIVGGVRKAVVAARLALPQTPIEVEAKIIAQVKQAISLRVDRILLDNMSLKTLRQAVKLCQKAKIKTEASGGVNLNNVKAIAKTGVDFISVGALTHSAPALDISLKLI
ncbi:nicotinate-nucleotide diphosphorylase (carboxylating) [candidate division WOR-1 bacterium RIFCSPLOWO2_12_FULL_45_9]|uniref:Probable nicotinate-nucleotide pyrophosphorylase [carboxylating] n=1 Tax=candidate division WOR-1 bacterium RIFCSPLOWO2_12_FULL_45_9 TaxID=1802568 RepID=A0A1F4RMR2_UNCSA|nr:MAG: nicotinate-nucleotide diphosphorylase (carboxylating) [candidate division WOR-1 bacterium RIFCSPLOWO2_12_FULL_45_9]